MPYNVTAQQHNHITSRNHCMQSVHDSRRMASIRLTFVIHEPMSNAFLTAAWSLPVTRGLCSSR